MSYNQVNCNPCQQYQPYYGQQSQFEQDGYQNLENLYNNLNSNGQYYNQDNLYNGYNCQSNKCYDKCQKKKCEKKCEKKEKKCKKECNKDKKCSKRCPKRCDDNCEKQNKCIEFRECVKTKCGTVSIRVDVMASPLFYSQAGQIITYSYNVVNTGTAVIYSPIQINDSLLGWQTFNNVYIPPGAMQSFTRTYTITASDLLLPVLISKITVYVPVTRRKWVVACTSNPIVITYGSADLFGSISQFIGTDGVSVVVNISNSGSSLTPASNVNLVLSLPNGVTGGQVSNISSTAPATVPTLNGNNIIIVQNSIPIGVTYQYRFTYGPLLTGSYKLSGLITSSTYDPNPNNNEVTNTIIV